MDRRTALKNASLFLGYTLSAPAIMGIMSGCQPEVIPGFEPAFFAKEQLGILKALTDTIIPKTDTPSASEVGVVEFMDNLLAVAMKPKEQEVVKKGMMRLAELAGDQPFDKHSAEKRMNILQQLEKEASGAEGPRNEQFWYKVKGLIVTGYMLSEKIGTEHLAYDPNPGEYIGCTDLSISGGKSWSI